MDCFQMLICVIVLIQKVFSNDLKVEIVVDQHSTISNETTSAYDIGINIEIINPEKYSLESFEIHQPTFNKMYEEFILGMGRHHINHQQWPIMNNYGLLPDTQESIPHKKSSLRDARSKRKFSRILNVGDILISSRSHSGLDGHAAIVVSKRWVLEMAGGKRWRKGIKDNNRQVSTDEWYDENSFDIITVYRCPDNKKAIQAALWADRNYFNPIGGQDKDIHVTYKLTKDFKSKNPSYSSKLVLQAYYYGTKGVIKRSVTKKRIIDPMDIPDFFNSRYELKIIEEFEDWY